MAWPRVLSTTTDGKQSRAWTPTKNVYVFGTKLEQNTILATRFVSLRNYTPCSQALWAQKCLASNAANRDGITLELCGYNTSW